MAIKKKLFNTNIVINGAKINTPLFPFLERGNFNYREKQEKTRSKNKKIKMNTNKLIKRKTEELQKALKECGISIKAQKLEKIIRDYIELNKLFFFFDINKELQKDFKEMFFETKEKDLNLNKKEINNIKKIFEKNKKKDILKVKTN